MKTFICPECGSRKAGNTRSVFIDPEAGEGEGSLRKTFNCAGCGYEIPGHLGERHDGLSIEDARKEWHSRYRRGARRRGVWLGAWEEESF